MSVIKPAELVQSSVTYQKPLMLLPFAAFSALGKKNGFFVKKGIYGTKKFTSLDVEGRMRPYHSGGPDDLALTLAVNEITTYLGEDYTLFEIASLLDTVWGMGIIDAETMKASQIGQLMIATKINRNLEAIRKSIWTGVRNAEGTTTLSLFDGFDVIIANEIAKSAEETKISEAIGNLSTMSAAIDDTNAMAILKEAYRGLPEEMRDEEIIAYLPTDIYDAYNDDYDVSGRGTLHDKKFSQTVLHGSDDKCTLIKSPYRSSDAPVIFSVKNNLTIALGGGGSDERVMVKEDNNAKMMQLLHMLFFGTGIQTFDYRMFHVAQQASDTQGE